MPNTLTLPVQVGTLPAGQCPATLQATAELFGGVYSVALPLGSGVTVIASASPPGSQFQTPSFAWLQLDDNLRPVRLYSFYTQWLSLHPLIPGHVMIWTGALPNFATFDGGDGNSISDSSGPMWEEVVDLRAKFPIGAGTLPASPAGTGATLNPGDSGGEQLHVLTTQEGAQDPAHTHSTGRFNAKDGTYLLNATQDTSLVHGNALLNEGSGLPPVPGVVSPTSPDATGQWCGTSQVLGAVPTVAGHNTMPPYFTVYFLRRTVRKFYAV